MAGAWTAATVAGGGGYLVMVGPKPLRFAEVKQRGDPEKMLPPLMMTNAAPTEISEPIELAGPPWPDPDAAQPALPQTADPSVEQETAPARAVTPDTLLQFFTPGKQGGTVITTPLEFSPPAPGQKSSTATYLSQ